MGQAARRRTLTGCFVDVPCLGTGTWRRNPDAKWRSRPEDLAELVERQQQILRSAARLVRPGGRLVYATCSLLREEDEAQAEIFLADAADFSLVPAARVWEETIGGEPRPGGEDYLFLTPARPRHRRVFSHRIAVFETKPANTYLRNRPAFASARSEPANSEAIPR